MSKPDVVFFPEMFRAFAGMWLGSYELFADQMDSNPEMKKAHAEDRRKWFQTVDAMDSVQAFVALGCATALVEAIKRQISKAAESGR